MIARKQVVKTLCWFQLIISVILAASIVFIYLTYRASLGQFIESLSETIASISKVVETTAETVEMNSSIIVSTRQMIVIGRDHINELNAASLDLKEKAPQFATFFRKASEKFILLGDSLNSVGEGLMFSAPTSVRMEGVRPYIVMSQPLEPYGKQLKEVAQQFKEIGNGMPKIANEGEKVVENISSNSEQALKLLDDAEKLLDRLQKNDLPRALQEMKSTSENLRNISQEVVNIGGNIGIVLLAFGLLLSGWCFLNSLTLLMMANQSVDGAIHEPEQG